MSTITTELYMEYRRMNVRNMPLVYFDFCVRNHYTNRVSVKEFIQENG